MRTRIDRLPKTGAHPNGQVVRTKFTKPGLGARRLKRRRRNAAAKVARRRGQ